MKGKETIQRPTQGPPKAFDIRYDVKFGKKDKAEQELKEHLQSAQNRNQPKWQ